MKSSNLLLEYLVKKKIAVIEELKKLLGTQSRTTVFRKLNKLDYISSCSHKGKFYSLDTIAEYNDFGIWQYNSAMFSRHGTVKKTLEILIENSSKGFTASELHSILEIKVEDVLLELVKNKRVVRKLISGKYVYYSKNPNQNKKQELTRNDSLQLLDKERMNPDVLMNELKAALIIFFSTLNEKQRRLYAGFESLKVGCGGDEVIAKLLNLNIKTVSRGRKELLTQGVSVDTIREKGGGRKQLKKKP
jgi:hypothetical protein